MSLSPTRLPRTIALAGLTVAGALLATAACSNSATPSSSDSASAAPSAPSAGKHHHAKGVDGKITAENGSTWTVVNAKGKQFTVDITPQTKFGTKAVPATQQQFTVGEQIRAAGQVTNGTVAANRIIQAKDNAGEPSN